MRPSATKEDQAKAKPRAKSWAPIEEIGVTDDGSPNVNTKIKNQVRADYETIIDVRKVGLERWLFALSREQPVLYGLMSLAIAIAAGWGASTAFRMIRNG